MTAGGVLGIIAARGGSVRLPRKNVLPFCGRPLIAWTVEAALASGSIDRVVTSTDDEEIAAAALAAGSDVPFLRPAHLATSRAGSCEVVEHVLDTLGTALEFVVLLQPTSPLRLSHDIDAAVGLARASGAPAVVSVYPFEKPWPVLRRLDGDDVMHAVETPAGGPATHVLNGAIYVVRPEALRLHRSFTPPGTLGYVMPAERSIDIDTKLDFILAEALAAVIDGG